MIYPRLVRIRQQFERPMVADIPAAVTAALEPLNLSQRIKPGQTVALTAGSRGIANIPLVLRSTAAYLKKLGAKPFLVPAMGSHGGGTVEGQRRIVESYGITEEFVGVPLRASMDTVQVGVTAEGFPVLLDRIASESDHIGVVARVKPHTGYHGPIESGLMKMMMIGLGKHAGALLYHRILLDHPFDGVVRSVGRTLMKAAPITFGLALVENAYDETAIIEGVAPEKFEPCEERLLSEARRLLMRLPFRIADLLIVDEIGKNISGSGMDTNVVGRKRAYRPLTLPSPPGGGQVMVPRDIPFMRLIYVRGLSAKTHGNATGVGLADFTSTRLVRQMDYRPTVINCLTAGYPEGAFVPVHFDTDREVIDAALAIIGTREPEQARILRIRNTLQLEELDVSEPCLEEAERQTEFTAAGRPRPLEFDAEGNLPPL
ncbi:MAG: nickel pincer cofactor-dependent isomerase, group 22 [Gemmataceae bacterium]